MASSAVESSAPTSMLSAQLKIWRSL